MQSETYFSLLAVWPVYALTSLNSFHFTKKRTPQTDDKYHQKWIITTQREMILRRRHRKRTQIDYCTFESRWAAATHLPICRLPVWGRGKNHPGSPRYVTESQRGIADPLRYPCVPWNERKARRQPPTAPPKRGGVRVRNISHAPAPEDGTDDFLSSASEDEETLRDDHLITGVFECKEEVKDVNLHFSLIFTFV